MSTVDTALTALGLGEGRSWHVRDVRTRFEKTTSLGSQSMPDFTLHNVTHSDNLIRILAHLQTVLGGNWEILREMTLA